ncbi:hypothetical protein E1162_03465 [Rhodobacteraceae bacterium RKSG542]|uniref:DUF6134 family protein n=1 Tax=Pseudovibrio flavus TaxID=2529854 RepID=UPI0012BB4F8C|nr:DUF6134 family protein [Pseudovibrio flavus]MTI16296.1 hypothetical protein [Pseudovibrio flavus]
MGTRVFAAAFATSMFALPVQMAESRPGNISFSVERNGKAVGTYTTSFRSSGGTLNVDAKMDIRVRLLGVPVYRFTYRADEAWRGNELEALKVSVNDNGKKRSLQGKRNGKTFSWKSGGKNQSVSGAIFPSNHWNAAVLRQGKVLNTLTGNVNSVRIRKAGTETLECRKGSIKATRYVYSGQIRDTESWYDRSGRWVGLRFKAQDGSTIFFRC